MVTVRDVHFAYNGAPVLRGVSLDIPRGSLVGILGPNGSGKTTLLRLLAGSLTPQSGAIELDGTAIGALPRAALARRIAVVPQDTHLAFDYTALEIVLMGRYPHLGAFEVEGPRDLRLARAALEVTGTAHVSARLFDTLSGGEKQRVVIASALAQLSRDHGEAGQAFQIDSNALLLLDEPTASLDLRYQLDVAAVLARLRNQGLTIVLSTHDLRLAASLSTAVVLLGRGLVLGSGAPRDALTADAIASLYEIGVDVAAPLVPA